MQKSLTRWGRLFLLKELLIFIHGLDKTSAYSTVSLVDRIVIFLL
jgi:hypothetical protein